jgi:hypothetical protein
VAGATGKMELPDVVTLSEIKDAAQNAFYDLYEWLKERKNRRVIPHRMERIGYVPTRNDDNKQGLWVVGESRQVIYAKIELSVSERIKAARRKKAGRGAV